MVDTKITYLLPISVSGISYPLTEHNLPSPPVESKNESLTLLTVQDVSRLLNIHENTVRRWSNQGVLKSMRLGPRGDRRYKLQDITNYLLSMQSGTVPQDK
jgi:excisionase family DNA binding protein